MSQQQPPPLILTKRVTAFLQSNLSPSLHTLLLASTSGKLLAHASLKPSPVSILRTQTTVAVSLCTLQVSAAYAIPDALSASSTPPASPSPAAQANSPVTITIQLTDGLVVVRRLSCALYLVCIGPPSATGADPASKPMSTLQHVETGTHSSSGQGSSSQTGSSPNDGESVMSTGAVTTTSQSSVGYATAGALAIRQQAEEIARSLDARLSGLRVPEDEAAD